MPKELAKLSDEFEDIKKRVEPMLDYMARLNNNFWNETTGNWGRFYGGIDMLNERLAALHAPSAAHPTAAGDPQVQAILQGMATAKADCKKISSEYWMTATRVTAIGREVLALKAKVDAVVQKKNAQLKKSNSLAQLQSMSAHLNTFKNDLDTAATLGGPHKPTHALLQ